MLYAPIGGGRHAAGVLIWGRWRHTDPDINLSSDRLTRPCILSPILVIP